MFVSRARGSGKPVACPTWWYLQISPWVMTPLHELPCGGLLRGDLESLMTPLKLKCPVFSHFIYELQNYIHVKTVSKEAHMTGRLQKHFYIGVVL